MVGAVQVRTCWQASGVRDLVRQTWAAVRALPVQDRAKLPLGNVGLAEANWARMVAGARDCWVWSF